MMTAELLGLYFINFIIPYILRGKKGFAHYIFLPFMGRGSSTFTYIVIVLILKLVKSCISFTR